MACSTLALALSSACLCIDLCLIGLPCLWATLLSLLPLLGLKCTTQTSRAEFWQDLPWICRPSIEVGIMAEGMFTPLLNVPMLFWRAGSDGSCLDALVSGGKLLDNYGVVFCVFNTTWIPGIAEAGILSGLSGCWWPSSSVEVGLLVCVDANCCWMALWCHWKQHQQPESGSCSAQPEGGLDWVSWLGDGVM